MGYEEQLVQSRSGTPASHRERVRLRNAAGFEAEVLPALGGGLCRWRLGQRELLRPAPAQVDHPVQLASFPLVPFSNRIAQGRFELAGRSVRLPANWPPHPHAIHGFGWQSPWSVAHLETARIVLAHRHAHGPWPWPYASELVVTLREERLVQRLAVTNLASTPMPAGLGLHPYFPKPPHARLAARAAAVWLTSPDGIPTERCSIPPEWDFAREREVDDLRLDHAFDGWDRSATLRWPDGSGVQVHASAACSILAIYAPEGCDFLCLEPVTHVPDALNRPEPASLTGLRVLTPGESFTIEVVLRYLPS